MAFDIIEFFDYGEKCTSLYIILAHSVHMILCDVSVKCRGLRTYDCAVAGNEKIIGIQIVTSKISTEREIGKHIYGR